MNNIAGSEATTSASLARNAIREALREERWRPGEQLPAERALSEMLDVNRMSLRQALLALENEGAIFRVDRKGWFVSQKRFVYDLTGHVSFQRSAATQGTATWTDLDQEVIEADDNNATLFGLNSGDSLLRIRGWGAFNGHRVFMHDVMVNLSAAPDFAERLGGQSFTTTWIEQYGITPRLFDLRSALCVLKVLPSRSWDVATVRLAFIFEGSRPTRRAGSSKSTASSGVSNRWSCRFRRTR